MLIELSDLCETFGVLPHSGGLLDQDPTLIMGISLVRQAYKERADRTKGRKR